MASLPEVQCNVPERDTVHRTAGSPRAAFIGTRRIDDVSRLSHSVYLDLVESAVAKGHTIRTGAAQGADQIAAMRALHLGGHVELVLPWETYEKEWVNNVIRDFGTLVDYEVYDEKINVSWSDSVYCYHPAPSALRDGAWALHARNYGIIKPCQMVVALTAPDRTGGTEQGIRISQGLGKNLIVLNSPPVTK